MYIYNFFKYHANFVAIIAFVNIYLNTAATSRHEVRKYTIF